MTANIDAEKADPADVAKVILDAVEQGTGNVLPDPVAISLWQAWNADPRGLDQLFAGG